MEYIAVLNLSTSVSLVVLTSIILVALVSIYLRTWCFVKKKANEPGRQRTVQAKPIATWLADTNRKYT